MHLVGSGQRHVRDDAHEPRRPLRAEVGLRGEKRRRTRRRRTPRPMRSSIAAITWSPLNAIGHGVHRGGRHAVEARQDALDGRGGEVLAVDAQPVGGATGEPEEPLVVAICQIAAPVPAVARPLGEGFVVAVVALEALEAFLVDDLAGGLFGVEQAAAAVEVAPAGTPASSRG